MGYPTRTEGVRKNVPGGKGHTRGIIGAGQGIYEASTTPLHQVGDRLPLWGGRVFYYASFSIYGATTGDAAAGDLVAADTSYNDQTVLTEVEDYTNDGSNYDPAIGAKLIEVTATGRKDQYANGTFHTSDATGEGYTYLIKRNSATGVKLNQDDPDLISTLDTFIIELYDGLVIALDNTTVFAITGNMFKSLLPAVQDTDCCPVGVTMIAIDVSDKEYAWVQTWGPATVATDSTAVTKGDIMVLSDTTRMVETMSADYTKPIVGYALAAPAATSGHLPIFLQLVP